MIKNDKIILVAGPPKTGTTFLHTLMRENTIFSVRDTKHNGLFTRIDFQPESVAKFFQNVRRFSSQGNLKVDVSPGYISNPVFPINLRKMKPNRPLVIVVLRDPYDRALSQVKHDIRTARLKSTKEKEKRQQDIIRHSQYSKFMPQIINEIGLENLVFVNFDSLNEKEKILKCILTAVNQKIPDDLQSSIEIRGKGYFPRSFFFERIKAKIFNLLRKSLFGMRLINFLRKIGLTELIKRLNTSQSEKYFNTEELTFDKQTFEADYQYIEFLKLKANYIV